MVDEEEGENDSKKKKPKNKKRESSEKKKNYQLEADITKDKIKEGGKNEMESYY